MSATSTHDTKRSEDVRARLNVLSELPGAWKQAIGRWARANRRGRSTIDGLSYPSRNEEYLLYQTIVGSWPAAPMTAEDERTYRDRIVEYMRKAMREAKLYSSWLNPSERHEDAMTRFIEFVLSPENAAFRADFLEFQHRIATLGAYNSLAQLALKVGAPGVPDFYQGTEIWDFSLVDPDNRRPVDYERRRALLRDLDQAVARDGRTEAVTARLADVLDDRVKLYATTALLRYRRSHLAIFRCGRYHPLRAMGPRADHLFAFARTTDAGEVLVVVPRLVATLIADSQTAPYGEKVWAHTAVTLPESGAASYRNVLTDERIQVRDAGGTPAIAVADVFARFPIAFLEAVDGAGA